MFPKFYNNHPKKEGRVNKQQDEQYLPKNWRFNLFICIFVYCLLFKKRGGEIHTKINNIYQQIELEIQFGYLPPFVCCPPFKKRADNTQQDEQYLPQNWRFNLFIQLKHRYVLKSNNIIGNAQLFGQWYCMYWLLYSEKWSVKFSAVWMQMVFTSNTSCYVFTFQAKQGK